MANTNRQGVLIKGMEIIEDDPWTQIDDEAQLPPTGSFTVSFARASGDLATFVELGDRVGVSFGPTDDPMAIQDLLGTVGLVTVRFDKFTDGRGYSTARVLRDQLGYGGELRAVGDILPDQAFYLRRCGFDAMVLAPGKQAEHALAALEEFSVTYQAAADDKRPLYARIQR